MNYFKMRVQASVLYNKELLKNKLMMRKQFMIMINISYKSKDQATGKYMKIKAMNQKQ